MASPTEQTNMIDKLRSLFLLIDPSVSSLTKAETEKRNELMKRFDYFVICSKKQADYYRLRHQQGTKYSFSTILSRFMQLLRECVLSHQWPEALNLIQSLCYEVNGVNCAIWKVGLACLFQDCEKNGRLVEQFVKQVCVLQSLTVVEVLLDYLLFILTQTQTADAMQLIKDLKENTQYPNNLKNKKRMMAHSLFFAYQSLACYAEWKLAIFKVSQEDDMYLEGTQADEISRRMNQGKNTDAAKALAENAVQYLGTVKDAPGVWDIFITHLVEIHEYYGQVENARNILESYRQVNSGNPNAHRYLYEFESRNGGDEHVLIQCLQDVIQLDPCNPLCLPLYHLKEKNDPGAVALLFDYLDYTHCSQNEQVWQVLADKLSNLNSHNLDDVLKQCWETRRDWWPHVIFRDLDQDLSAAEASQPGTLVRNKQIVRDVLLHLDEPLTKKRKMNIVLFGKSPDEPLIKKRKMNIVLFGRSPGSKRRKMENPE